MYDSLFKIVDIDTSDGYVTYEDVFTNKKYKVIDIAMSSSIAVTKERTIFLL